MKIINLVAAVLGLARSQEICGDTNVVGEDKYKSWSNIYLCLAFPDLGKKVMFDPKMDRFEVLQI